MAKVTHVALHTEGIGKPHMEPCGQCVAVMSSSRYSNYRESTYLLAPSAGAAIAVAVGAGAESSASWPRPLGTGLSSAGTPSAGFSSLISPLISPGVWAVEEQDAVSVL